MKRASNPKGFTIVETMIFLAVSGALMVSAFALLGGSQNKAQFNTAIREIDQQINTVANNVVNGYYPGLGSNKCEYNSSPPELTFTASGGSLGDSQDCVFLGKIVEFSDNEEIRIHSIAGIRETAPGKPTTKMVDSVATAIDPPEIINLKNGLRITSIKVGSTNIGAIGFFNTLGDLSGSSTDLLISGGLTLDYVGLPDSLSASNSIPGYVTSQLRGNYDSSLNANKNPPSGITICFRSGSTDQFGELVLGGTNNTGTTTLVISNVDCT